MPKRPSRKKPRVTIIGPGRLGTALAIALSDRGYPITALVGRHSSRVRKAAALLDVPPQPLVAEDIQHLTVSDLILLTTPDDQIPAVAQSLLKACGESTVLHSSGALSSEVLHPLAAKGWEVGSIHPLVSVSDPVVGAAAFKGSFWCVEGSRKAVQVAKRLVRDLGGHSFSIRTTAKPLYHAAAVMASGNVVALFDVAIAMLTNCGLTSGEARRVLLPLLESTLMNLRLKAPARALTGTFARGDLATVEKHLAALSTGDLADARALYRLLGRRSLELAQANGVDPRVVKRIVAKLKQ